VLRAPAVFLLQLSLAACTVVGSKEALVLVDSPDWKLRKTGWGDSYYYSCDDIYLQVNEIVFTTETAAYGPVIPIIPSGKNHDYNRNNLSIEIEVVGKTVQQAYSKEDFGIDASTEGRELNLLGRSLDRISDRPMEDSETYWIQYRLKYSYDIRLQDLAELSLEFRFPFADCYIPHLVLRRSNMSDNEIIIAPGH
jgi:hypothetical protein